MPLSTTLKHEMLPCPLPGVNDAAHPPYNPHPVPPRDERRPSMRDDVRRLLYSHGFRPSTTHYTDLSDIYRLYLAAAAAVAATHQHQALKDSPGLEDKFRSALGRVLHPPKNADEFARSFAAPDARRWNSYIGMRAPAVPCIELKQAVKAHKLEQGRVRRRAAADSDTVNKLREDRLRRKQEKVLNGDGDAAEAVPQHVSFRYVDEFVGLACAEDLMRLKLYPNGKELAESMSAFANVRQHLLRRGKSRTGVAFGDKTVTVVAVGDGVTPRTAGLFAFRTQWQCVSIDPMMRNGAWESVSNLQTMRARIQDVVVQMREEGSHQVVFVLWHAHVSLLDTLNSIRLLEKNDNDRDNSDERQEGASRDGVRVFAKHLGSDLEKEDSVEDDAENKLGRAITSESEWSKLRNRVAVVSCACCNYDEVQRAWPDGAPPDVEGEDIGVPGQKRVVRAWRFTNQLGEG